MSREQAPDTESTEYGLRNLPFAGDRPDVDERQLRAQYGWVRAFFKARPHRHGDLQRWLNQARYGQSYDVYLQRNAWLSLAVGLGGGLLAVALSVTLAASGVFEGLTNPLPYDGAIVYHLAEYKSLYGSVALTIVFATIFAIGSWAFRYRYPRIVVSSRRRNIDVTLPHGIVFMYALSRGGMDLLEVLRVLADSKGTYGELANEAETIVREVEYFGNDIHSALRNVRNTTPSDNFEQFLDDLLGVLDSGGDLTVFFESESEAYLEDARDEQQSFLETLAVLSEFFVVLFVAAPLFVIVMLVVMSLLGGQTLSQLVVLVYAILPLSMLGFLVLLDTLSEPYKQPAVHFGDFDDDVESGFALVGAVLRDAVTGTVASLSATDTPSGTEQRARYLAHRRRRALLASLSDPLAAFRAKPVYSLAVTAPLALLVGVAVVTAGVATPTQTAMLEQPIPTTTWLVVVPLLVVMIPLSLLHEGKRRRDRRFLDRFPDTLSILASANKMGISFDDGLGLVARWSTGPLSREMHLLRNDLRWNFDTRGSMRGMADRVGIPQLARTMTLIGEGIRSTSDVAAILSIAARDTKERFKLDRERRQELTPYIAVVVIGFAVFLLVVVLLDKAYLGPIAESTTQTPPTVATGQSVPLTLTNVPTEAYRALFLHAAVIQALGGGLLAGKLADDDALSGLKYSIVMLVVAIAAFALI